MTQENKELLIKDLCARLPYGVKCDINDNKPYTLSSISNDCDGILIRFKEQKNGFNMEVYLSEVKPYLFPLSSMTEEQWNNAPRVNLTEFTFESLKCGCFTLASYTCENNLYDLIEFINWLIENHFDIYGLIPMGLANDATGLNIY